jgi:hypothetical protein
MKCLWSPTLKEFFDAHEGSYSGGEGYLVTSKHWYIFVTVTGKGKISTWSKEDDEIVSEEEFIAYWKLANL